MIKLMIRRIFESIAPKLTDEISQARWLRQDASIYFESLQKLSTLSERVDFARSHSRLPSNQKRSEIIALLERVQTLKPRILCEIGTDLGGTLGLFGSVASRDARILSMDIQYRKSHLHAVPLMIGKGQAIKCLEADSHSPETKRKVLKWLGGEKIDFLFIDGDHSYEGVKADFEMYSTLVKSGGIVAFHDIVPDFFTRFGTKTASDVGEVPRFWRELSNSSLQSEEFIEDKNQDGYGIGLIRIP